MTETSKRTDFAALIGLDWGWDTHAIALAPVDGPTQTSTLKHSAESLHQWLDQLEQTYAGRSIAVAVDFLNKWPRLTDVQASKDITLRNFYYRHNIRRAELIQNRIDLRRSARLLTRDSAIIEVSVRIVRMLVAELRVLVEHITEFE